MLHPNYKGNLASSQNLFPLTTTTDKSSHVYTHTTSTANKSKKQEDPSRQSSFKQSSMTFTNQLASHLRNSIKQQTNNLSLSSPRITTAPQEKQEKAASEN